MPRIVQKRRLLSSCRITVVLQSHLMKVYLDSIGCRLNQSEIETMARQLLAAGHEIVQDADSAESIILNTCAVTKEATRDTRQKTRRFHRANPDAEIILTGCHATLSPDNLITLDGVKVVVPNSDKQQLVQHIVIRENRRKVFNTFFHKSAHELVAFAVFVQ